MRGLLRQMLLGAVALGLCPAPALHGADLEFSHAIHLGKVGLSCTFCHSSAEQSAAAADHNLPEQQLCLACHDGKTAPVVDASPLAERTPAARVFSFDHQRHLALGGAAARIREAIDRGVYLGRVGSAREGLDDANACTACHRGLETAARSDSKLPLPRMSDCLVCHDKIDNPFSCEECHARGFELKPADHTRDFIDQHSSGKMGFDKLTCQPCHGKTFTCMGCH